MKLLRIREKLGHIGLLLLEHGDGFLVTNSGVDLEFASLAEVEQWMKDQRHANRLTDRVFCEAWRCLDVERQRRLLSELRRG